MGVESFLTSIAAHWKPHPGQREFLLADARTKVLACGRRWGKTEACAVEIAHAACRDKAGRHVVVAPTQDQARLLFDRVVVFLGRLGRPAKAKYTPYPQLDTEGHLVTARSGHLPENLRGFEADTIVVDEAPYLPESTVTEVLAPMLATTDGQITLIGTPHGLNFFWRFFQMGQRREFGVWSRQAPSSENPRVSRNFLEIQRNLVSERAFAVEYEAEFRQTEGAVFRQEAVEGCLAPYSQIPREGPFTIGIDFGRHQDFTAIVVLSGTEEEAGVVALKRFHRVGWDAQIERIRATVSAYPEARVTVDSTGVGDRLVDDVRAALPGHGVEGYAFNSRSKPDLIQRLERCIERRVLRMEPDPQLMRELEFYVADGQGGTSAKSGHDDLVTALALAVYGLEYRSYAPILVGGIR